MMTTEAPVRRRPAPGAAAMAALAVMIIGPVLMVSLMVVGAAPFSTDRRR